MPDLQQFADFHFLRPWWLLGLLPALLLYLAMRWEQSVMHQWEKWIAPALLKHLTVGMTGRRKVRPVHLMVTVLVIASIALAGPTWQRETTPFAEDEAPLIVVLDLSPSMNATDIQPSRLERAKQKIRDLLALRSGARTALVAYAGTAHLVFPLTGDANIIEQYLAALTTELMPQEGKDAAEGLLLAQELLAADQTPGTILFLTDGIGSEHLGSFVEHSQTKRDQVALLAIGTTEGGTVRDREGNFVRGSDGQPLRNSLDREALDTLSGEAGVYVTTVTVDDSDVRRVDRRVDRHLSQALNEDESRRWVDSGYWLVYPVAFLAIFWFRRGWTIQWQ